MGERREQSNPKTYKSNSGEGLRRVRFPVLSNMNIVCPICNGAGCNVCNKTGEYELEYAPYVEIQRPLIIKYIADNMKVVSSELSRLYGKTPEVDTEIVANGYEVIRIDSLSGSLWIALSLDKIENPKYFYQKESMEKWLVKEK